MAAEYGLVIPGVKAGLAPEAPALEGLRSLAPEQETFKPDALDREGTSPSLKSGLTC